MNEEFLDTKRHIAKMRRIQKRREAKRKSATVDPVPDRKHATHLSGTRRSRSKKAGWFASFA